MRYTSGSPRLLEKIASVIQNSPDQCLSFYRFMDMALYDELDGYYISTTQKLGKEGDFYTSSSIGSYMGQQLAATFIEMADKLGDRPPLLVEFGAGEGTLAKQILDEWSRLRPKADAQPRLVLFEKSPYHRKRQKEQLSAYSDRITWSDELESLDFATDEAAIVYSNELIDAMPVHRIKRDKEGLHEFYVTVDVAKQAFTEVLKPLSSEVRQYIERYRLSFTIGQEAEINLDAEKWILQLGKKMNRGYVVTIDYGYPREELYAVHRMKGTLLGYYKHQTNANPYERIGEQDLTSHVDFTTLIEAGKQVGMDAALLLTQREFLINSGILEKVVAHSDNNPFTSEAMRINRAIRQLMVPSEMGEVFKVLIQAKGIEAPWPLRCQKPYFL